MTSYAQLATAGTLTMQQDDLRSLTNHSEHAGGNNVVFLDSTESTLVLLYNFREQKYQFLPNDKARLANYYDPHLFEKKVLN